MTYKDHCLNKCTRAEDVVMLDMYIFIGNGRTESESYHVSDGLSDESGKRTRVKWQVEMKKC